MLRSSHAPRRLAERSDRHRLEPVSDRKKRRNLPANSPAFDLHQGCNRTRVLSVIASSNTSARRFLVDLLG
jgi:hypothetical protein